MEATYFINLLGEKLVHDLDLPLTTLIGHPYLERCALIAIYNGNGSSVRLKIRRIVIRPLISQSSTSSLIAFEYRRITTLSNGTPITPIKMDTSLTSLPSQILIRKGEISAAGSSIFQRSMNQYRLNLTAAGRLMGSKVLGQTRSNLNRAEEFKAGYINTETQGWVLREGEGVAITLSSVTTTMHYQLYCVFSTSDGTYFISETINPIGNAPVFAVFNGSGSGKLVTIKQLEIQEIGEDNLPYFTSEKIDGVINGEILTPEKMDSNSSNLPSQVLIRTVATVMSAGHKIGALITNPSLRRGLQPIYGTGVNFAGIDMTGLDYVFKQIELTEPFILQEGEGFAIFNKTASALGLFEVYIEFTKEDIGGGVIGEPSFVWSG